MNGPRLGKDFFGAMGPLLEPFSRILFVCVGMYFVAFASARAFSQAPLLVFLVGCLFAFAGLNGMRFSGFAVSKDGFRVESHKVSEPSPISPELLKGSQLAASERPEDFGDHNWTPVNINWSAKQGIAGIATTASGETTRADQIQEVYAIGNDVNHLFVVTSNGRALKLDFAKASGTENEVGIQ